MFSYFSHHIWWTFCYRCLQPSTNGGECQPGEYCPLGSPAVIQCTEGYFCNQSGLAAPMAECDPGYYCPTGSSHPRQKDCWVGHYCPMGSTLPTPCSNGTYNPSTNQDQFADCLPCTSGFYCNETGSDTVSGICDAGRYNMLRGGRGERGEGGRGVGEGRGRGWGLQEWVRFCWGGIKPGEICGLHCDFCDDILLYLICA